MVRMTRMARTVARMARWLADLADPEQCSDICRAVIKGLTQYPINLICIYATLPDYLRVCPCRYRPILPVSHTGRQLSLPANVKESA